MHWRTRGRRPHQASVPRLRPSGWRARSGQTGPRAWECTVYAQLTVEVPWLGVKTQLPVVYQLKLGRLFA